MKRNQKGFTLIELLVVIAIIGLLSTLAIVSLNSARSKARDAKRVSDMRQIQTAMEVYYTDFSSYAVSCSGIVKGCADANFTTFVPNLSKITDPSASATACNATNTQCDYAWSASSPPSATAYTILFWTENSTVQGLTAGQQHTLTSAGLN